MNSMPLSYDYEALPAEISDQRAPGWWGMILLITTEASLFACLIAGYFYLRAGAYAWPLGGLEKPKLLRPIVMTIVLLASSAPMARAYSGIKKGHTGALRLGLGLSFLLGATFIVLQIFEYRDLTFAVTANAYSSVFLTITALDGMHVIAGLLAIAYIFIRACLGHFRPDRNLAVQNVALYWYFVVVLWLFIFLALYLSPRFL